MTTPSRTRRTARACSAACLAAALALPLGLPATAGARDAAAPAPGGGGIGDPYFPTYGNSGYDVQRYDLAVRYDPGTDRLQGRARLAVKATRELSSFHLDLVGLTVRSVRVDGVDARWSRHAGHELVVRPAQPLARGRIVTVEVRYSGVPQPFTAPLLGTTAWLETPDGVLAVGEPQVAAHWFPVNDHPADKARYRIAITVPRGVEAISNGLPGARTVSGRWATTTWEVRDPMASYLAFLAIGQFDVHRWRTADGLPVVDAVDSSIQGPLRRRIDASFARQGEILSTLSQWFGPYPFEAVGGVVDRVDVGFALENQTRPTYSALFWDIPQAPTLGDSVVAHELAHQWYGDSVALRRWSDVWLNEGFATYAEWLWTEREFGFTPQEQFTSLYGIPADDAFWQLRIGDPGPDRLFDGAVYVRGAMTLQALRREIGREDFFAVLRAWAQENRNGHGTTAAFTALAERISGRSLDRLFQAWLFTPGRPAAPSASAGAAASPTRQAQVDAAVRAWREGLELRLAHAPH